MKMKMKDKMTENRKIARAVRHRLGEDALRSKWVQIRANKDFLDKVAELARLFGIKSRSAAVRRAVEAAIAEMKGNESRKGVEA